MKKDVMEKDAMMSEDMAGAEEKSLEKKVDMEELIEKGKKGDLSTSDLDEAMENMDFDMDSLEKLEHVGIRNVRKRLGYMGNGTLTIESREGVGTMVTITIFDRKD